MVKAEVRATDARGQIESLQAVVADLESDLVEQSVHHARVLSRVRSDLEQVDARIAELERLVGRLADVVAAATLQGVETSGTD